MNPRSFLWCKYYICVWNSNSCHSQHLMAMCLLTRMLKDNFWRVQQLHKKCIKLNAVLYITTRSTLDRILVGNIPCEYSGFRRRGTGSFPIMYMASGICLVSLVASKAFFDETCHTNKQATKLWKHSSYTRYDVIAAVTIRIASGEGGGLRRRLTWHMFTKV